MRLVNASLNTSGVDDFDQTHGIPGSPGTDLAAEALARAAQSRLRRRRVLQFVTVLLLAVLGFFYASLQPKVYEASALLQFSPAGDHGRSRSGKISKRVFADEAAVLTSRTFLTGAVKDIHLAGKSALIGGKKHARAAQVAASGAEGQFVSQIQGALRVRQVPQTVLFSVTFDSSSPQLAAAIVNGVVDASVRNGAEAAYQQRIAMTSFVGHRLTTLQQQIEREQSELKQAEVGLPLDAFASSFAKTEAPGLPSSGGRSTSKRGRKRARPLFASDPILSFVDDEASPAVDPLEKEAVQAKLARQLAQANLEVVRALEASGDKSAADNDGAKAALVTRLIADLDRDQATYASSVITLGVEQPSLRALTAQMDEIKQELTAERLRENAQLQSNVDLAKANEKTINSEVVSQRSHASTIQEARLKTSLLRLGLALDLAVYENLREKLLSAPVNAGLNAASIDVVTRAETPLTPLPRPILQTTLLCGFLGLVLALVLAKVADHRNARLWTIAQLERFVDFGVISIIPKAPSSQIDGEASLKSRPQPSISARRDLLAEAFRELKQTIVLSMIGNDPRVLLFTSAVHSEGRTTCAAHFALTLAQQGSRVLLIDCDLRRPIIHKYFHLPGSPGLSSLLTGGGNPGEFLQGVPGLPRLNLLVAGPVPTHPAELLGSTAMKNLLQQMRQEFDYVVLDTPPVLPVTDALALSQLVDATLLVCGYGKVKLQSVRVARELLTRSHAPLVGLLVNDVPHVAGSWT